MLRDSLEDLWLADSGKTGNLMRWRSAQQGTQCTMSLLSVRARVSSSCASSTRSSRRSAPDALENSPGSHASQALAPAAQVQAGARCRQCKRPSVSKDERASWREYEWPIQDGRPLPILTFTDLRQQNRIPVCTRCTLPILLKIKDQLQDLR